MDRRRWQVGIGVTLSVALAVAAVLSWGPLGDLSATILAIAGFVLLHVAVLVEPTGTGIRGHSVGSSRITSLVWVVGCLWLVYVAVVDLALSPNPGVAGFDGVTARFVGIGAGLLFGNMTRKYLTFAVSPEDRSVLLVGEDEQALLWETS